MAVSRQRKVKDIQARLAAQRAEQDRRIAELVATWHVATEEETEARATLAAAVAERHRLVRCIAEENVAVDDMAALFEVTEDDVKKMLRAAKQSQRRARAAHETAATAEPHGAEPDAHRPVESSVPDLSERAGCGV